MRQIHVSGEFQKRDRHVAMFRANGMELERCTVLFLLSGLYFYPLIAEK
jgi:hypothetical protein